ncbi:ABC transporter substrate-binding protein [Actinoallomurus iriomotensis]|uniref:Amino acid ABC transporter substrate-binding protein n=1 Tax=Actinoallomurus iriomotensis TaxID=478107 RepID=A0A9W6RGP6_9ACTN|nr:ABC transporter substrate-binding protein [Actinoallomurus iriomotensis]GLY75766.1 amino acid ABC transporter substrate-binding protein [Actinoallomurus iriomotensis]
MPRSSLPLVVAGLTALTVVAPACAPADSTGDTKTSATATGTAACVKDKLKLIKPGTLTVATDKPAFAPWFKNDDPANGQGFESAVTYAVANKLGFAKNEVTWTTESFDSSYAPGPKKFDFDINQISVTPERRKAVTFSDGYYDVAQAVVAADGGTYAGATSVNELKNARIAVQVGTTALQAVRRQIQPATQPRVFNNEIDAINALKNKQVDVLVLDLPTAFYVTAAQVKNSKIVGQLPRSADGNEQFGLLLQRGNPLVGCLNVALGQLKSSGELARIQDRWLTSSAGAAVLK